MTNPVPTRERRDGRGHPYTPFFHERDRRAARFMCISLAAAAMFFVSAAIFTADEVFHFTAVPKAHGQELPLPAATIVALQHAHTKKELCTLLKGTTVEITHNPC